MRLKAAFGVFFFHDFLPFNFICPVSRRHLAFCDVFAMTSLEALPFCCCFAGFSSLGLASSFGSLLPEPNSLSLAALFS